MMKHLTILIFCIFSVLSCKQQPKKNEENKILKTKATSDLSQSNNTKLTYDTIKSNLNALKEWDFNNEKISLLLSEKSDEFYNYGYLKIGNFESKQFVKIPKEDSPYTGFERMVIKYPYFTVEQAYREGENTNYEYITFKKEDNFINLYKSSVDYTSTQNLEENITGLRLNQKTFGKVKIEDITTDFLYSLRK